MPYKILKQNQFTDEGGYLLTSIRPQDIQSIRIWRNQQMEVLRQNKLITSQEQVEYFDKAVWPTLAESQPKQILVSFLYREELIGYGGLTNIDWPSKRAEISFLLDPHHAENRELYRQDFLHFLTLLSKLTFEDLELQRLFTETYAFRELHIKILEEFGMQREGVLRQHVNKGGSFYDTILHGLLCKEYLNGK